MRPLFLANEADVILALDRYGLPLEENPTEARRYLTKIDSELRKLRSSRVVRGRSDRSKQATSQRVDDRPEQSWTRGYLRRLKKAMNLYLHTFAKGNDDWPWVQAAMKYGASPLDVPRFIRYCIERGIEVGMPGSREEARFYETNLKRLEV